MNKKEQEEITERAGGIIHVALDLAMQKVLGDTESWYEHLLTLRAAHFVLARNTGVVEAMIEDWIERGEQGKAADERFDLTPKEIRVKLIEERDAGLSDGRAYGALHTIPTGYVPPTGYGCN